MALWSLTTLRDIRAARRIDSEFFRPDYVFTEGRVRACNVIDLGRLGGFVPGPFGSAFHVQNYDVKSPYRYIRGRDVKPFFLLNDDNRYIPESDFKRLRQYEVRNDDLMVSVVGTLGNVSVCTEDDTPAMFSCKSTLLRALRADPYFLLAYLNSATGQLCMLRRQRGAIQTGLNIEDLRTIPVPRFGPAIEDELAASVRKAHSNLFASRDAYETAQQLLEAELGLDKLAFQKPRGYTARFSEIGASLRTDAEFFLPKYQAIIKNIQSKPYTTLGRTFSISRGVCIDPRLYSDREGIAYIRIKELSLNQALSPEDSIKIPLKHISANYPRANAGDYVVAVIGATIGKVNLINERMAMSLYSNNTACLSPKCKIEYPNATELLLRSPCVQQQIQQRMAKTAQEKIADPELRKIIIPVLDAQLLSKLEQLCESAKMLAHESKHILTQAKGRVEQLIEEAVQP